MLPLRPHKKSTLLRRWTVRTGALLTIIGTLLLLFVDQPSPSTEALLQNRLFGLRDFALTRPHVSSTIARLSSNQSCTSGYIFTVPDDHSPAIFDQDGDLIWQEKRHVLTQNLRVQTFHGQDYLTYWTKEGSGPGRYQMLDSSYTTRYTITPVGIITDSLHDFTVTRRDTALIAAHYKRRADLSALGGPVDGWILDGMIQEIDIATGKLLYEWRAAEHVPVTDTLKVLNKREGTEDHPFDYFHISGVDQSASGGYLLVSAGNMRAVMSIDASTGQVQWRLGGRANDFEHSGNLPVVDFVSPHNARWGENDTLTAMDKGGSATGSRRGMIIQINPRTSQAGLRQTYDGPTKPQGQPDGDMQISQSTGNALISWGGGSGLSEFSTEGNLLCEDSILNPLSLSGFLGSTAQSHVSKHAWTGKPVTKPVLKSTGHTLQVHWNGATEVAEWQLDLKEQKSSSKVPKVPFREIGRFKKTGFETWLAVPPLKGQSRYSLRVAALDQEGRVLGYTDDLEWQQAWMGSDLSQSQFRVLAGVSSIVSNLGLTATNYTSAFLLWNYTYAYMLSSTRLLRLRAGIAHNVNPRYDVANYGERAVAEGKITRKKLLQIQRGESAHANSVEGFALFASTIVLMNVAKLDAETINLVGVAYSIFRIGYVQAYFYIEDYKLSYVRSVLWHLCNFSCFYGIWWAGKALQA